MKIQLIYPMAFYVLFMWGSAIYMFRSRFKAARTGQVSVKYFKALQGEPPPEKIVLIARHYDNQFQVPIVFLLTCLAHMQLGFTNALTLILAWFFVVSRMAHSFIMLGRNKVLLRATAFGFGWLFIGLLWFQLLYFALQA